MTVPHAITYHNQTKYAPETIGNHPGLDWERQPIPYKLYDSLTPVALAPFLPFDPNPFTGKPRGPESELATDGRVDLAVISRWLFATYGITGVIPNEARPTYLRAAPSAGGLYPAEIYLVVRELAGCEPGLYGYDPRRHHLVPLWNDAAVAGHLAAACYHDAAVAAAPVALVVTGVFERSRWRYGERAYRRILLDSGHLIGNACLMAPALGLRVHLTAAFCDGLFDEVLRIDPAEEGTLAVIALNAAGKVERPHWSALPSGAAFDASPAAKIQDSDADADADAAEADPSPLLHALHRASRLPHERPRVVGSGDAGEGLEARYGWTSGASLVEDVPNREAARWPLAQDPFQAILRRRSTRRFQRGTMTRAQLARILAAAYAPETVGLGEQPSLDRGHLMTFVAVLAVEGFAPGVYYLAPHGLELRLVRPGCDPETVQYLCLGQELGGDATAVVFHTADLADAVRAYGDRAYRYLHLDAGMIGERLDLAAISEGCGASGIGGFFDDQVTDLLGIPREQAVVYITTLGLPAQSPPSADG
ncbi:MAG: SagB/ThcOx family dehydrogenase [Planctomycetes bacterium]|nr:SagB/ThcOx family dehydrogenase [Planctomycetota bacterium]